MPQVLWMGNRCPEKATVVCQGNLTQWCWGEPLMQGVFC